MMFRSVRFALTLGVAAAAIFTRVCPTALLAAEEPKPLRSPIIHDDGRLTVSLKAPKAAAVKVSSGELQRLVGAEPLVMSRDDDGVWSTTIGPIAPGIYDFAFDVDGVRVTDPLSVHVMGNRTGARGYLEVPGPADRPRIDQWRDVPHGAVTQVWYRSKATGTRRSMHVYTPPGYNKNPDAQYPVVYLLHGSGDDDRHWSALGQANVIADNLIAAKKCVPMLIVMPEGHPAGTATSTASKEDRERHSLENRRLFAKDLLEDVVPLVDAEYRTRDDRANRAIVGLSMGGGQSLDVGLQNLDCFAWIGSFSGSASRLDGVVSKLSADPEATNKQLLLLWIAIGKDDFLLASNREFTAKLKNLGIKHEYLETDGAHSWGVWRGYLADFLPRLFHVGEPAK